MPGKPNPLKAYAKAERNAAHSTYMAGRVALAPSDVARIRLQIAKNIEDYLPIVDQVIHGTRDFSPTQARLFTALLNKVVPDLSATFHQHEVAEVPLTQMTTAQLEAIALGANAMRQADARMVNPDDVIEGEVLTSAQPDTSSPFIAEDQ